MRFFGDAVAVCAAILALFSAPLTFYELMLLRDSAIVFAGLALMWLTDMAVEKRKWTWSGLLGVALGLGCLLKSTLVLLAAALFVVIVVRLRREPQWLLACGAAVIGLSIAIVPFAARNTALGVPPLSLAASGPLTFVASNEVTYLPDVGFGINAPVLARFLGETTGGWIPAAILSLGSHTVGSYASLLWRKWDRLWHWYEIPNNENIYYMRRQVSMLAWLPVTFWACSPLALAGLVLGARRFRHTWPLYLFVVVSALPLIVFYSLARFRLALVAAVLPFAALTLVTFVDWMRSRIYGRAIGLLASVAFIASWTGRPLADDQRLIRMADWILPYSVYYQDKVFDALDSKDFARAAAWYLEFFRYEPSLGEIARSGDPSLGPELADMHRECASILTQSGQTALAQAQIEQADRILRSRTP